MNYSFGAQTIIQCPLLIKQTACVDFSIAHRYRIHVLPPSNTKCLPSSHLLRIKVLASCFKLFTSFDLHPKVDLYLWCILCGCHYLSLDAKLMTHTSKKSWKHQINTMGTIKTVIRRSHVKSRNGCQACKRKRVKCDEFRPIWLVILSGRAHIRCINATPQSQVPIYRIRVHIS